MTKLRFSSFLSLLFTVFFSFSTTADALGSGATIAVTATAVCGVAGGNSRQPITCYDRTTSSVTIVLPNTTSFSAISGGDTFLCGLRSGGFAFLCWNTSPSTALLDPKRIYSNNTVTLQFISVGDSQICATMDNNGTVQCWRGDGSFVNNRNPVDGVRFDSISSGFGFSCGVLAANRTIRCWGRNSTLASSIESHFRGISMLNIELGGYHACGFNATGFVVCKGDNSSGQLNVPAQSSGLQFTKLSLGGYHSCAIRVNNGSVVCWGGEGRYVIDGVTGVFLETIVSGSNFTCGLTVSNLSVVCWGPGWSNTSVGSNSTSFQLPLPEILPGPCVQSSCDECGLYPGSQRLCGGSRNICRPCPLNVSVSVLVKPPASSPPLSPPTQSVRRSNSLTTGLLVFCIIGSVGCFAAICTILYCLWTGVCFGKKKVHNSVQPTITRGGSNGSNNNGTATSNNSGFLSRSSTIRRQGSRLMRRQRSGTSSKHADRAEEFTLGELAAATNDFLLENKIGAGSFGVVYKGKLADGREVAIKRGEIGQKSKKYQEKESAFESELSFLSRLHHKHLVRLVGYCEDGDERLLVYEYMKNGALYDHLHDRNNVDKSHSLINSWKMRIKIALDAARGIEYLHNYAVPSIIHRDIKSSNILLDGNWTARVSDFGLSLMGPETERDQRKPMKAAGTVGYIDPEYYGLNVLTDKSDVYGFGVVLLELLTGKKAIFKNEEDEGTPTSIVDFAVPRIQVNELAKILDMRVGPPMHNETEAVELVAYTAMHCVNLEGKDRPTMSDIVANLERALSLSDISHGSISSGSISIVSD